MSKFVYNLLNFKSISIFTQTNLDAKKQQNKCTRFWQTQGALQSKNSQLSFHALWQKQTWVFKYAGIQEA